MRSPIFSVIIPTYNRAYLIKKTILSLLNQSFTDFEIIIVDDGSTDNTKEVVASISDTKIQYFSRQNEERGAARNFGAKMSKGTYLNFFDSDDIAYPWHLETAFSIIQKHENIPILYFGYDIKTNTGELLEERNKVHNLKQQFLSDNLLSCNGIFICKEVALKHPFNEDKRLSGTEDYLLWLQLLARYKFHIENRITTSLIQHSQRSVNNYNSDKMISRLNIFIQLIMADREIVEFYNKKIRIIKGYTYSFISLHLSIGKNKKQSMKYLLQSLTEFPTLIFTKRFYAIIKHLII